MEEDPQKGPPPEPAPTVTLARPSQADIMASTISGMNTRLQQILDGQAMGFRRIEQDFELISHDLNVIKGRVGVVESRQNVMDEWRRSSSERAKSLAGRTSEADLSHEKMIADEIVARESLAVAVAETRTLVGELDAKQDRQLRILVETAGDVRRFLATPTVKILGGILFGMLTSYVANRFGVNVK